MFQIIFEICKTNFYFFHHGTNSYSCQVQKFNHLKEVLFVVDVDVDFDLFDKFPMVVNIVSCSIIGLSVSWMASYLCLLTPITSK